jgi:hypothetical protein
MQADMSQITLSYLMYIEAHSLMIISRSLESVCLCSKVIPLSGFHCSIIMLDKATCEHTINLAELQLSGSTNSRPGGLKLKLTMGMQELILRLRSHTNQI